MIEFSAQVMKGNRITIPKWLIDSASIKEGDILKIALIQKVVVEVKEKQEKRKG